ncbi:hypothetical protein llap_13340 [Limosa lapponica baueri]|uniref:Uncharacterized protein n=1 Tax=Limosa lapponica baueri TaxID=1758121 RepID=A0A2I0TRF1_LIMLA|nr:hypothetical protein llap_13340 [Limosa lapponica baueri]
MYSTNFHSSCMTLSCFTLHCTSRERFHGEVVESLTLEMFKSPLDMVTMLQWGERWTRWSPEVPSNLNQSVSKGLLLLEISDKICLYGNIGLQRELYMGTKGEKASNAGSTLQLQN